MMARRVLATALTLALCAPARAGTDPAPSPSSSPVAVFSDPSVVTTTPELDNKADLSHIDYTATQSVPVSLVYPAPESFGGVATPFVVSTGSGAGVELQVNGEVVPATHIGKEEVSKSTGETRYTFYGVGLVPGPNSVQLTSLGAGGFRFVTAKYTVYGRGPAVSLTGKLKGPLVADGHSTQLLHIIALDRWQHPAMAGVPVHAAITSGDITFGSVAKPSVGASAVPDVSNAQSLNVPSAPPSPVPFVNPQISSTSPPSGFSQQNNQSAQIGTPSEASFSGITNEDGALDIILVPGLRPSDGIVRVTSDNDVSSDVPVSVLSYARPVMITGLVTGGAGAVPGDPGTDPTAPHEANSRRGRVALFGTGQVAKNVSASVAYDTAGVLDENGAYGSFDENPNQRPYLTYGDSSVRRADALSTNHLFARVNTGASSLAYGEFSANTADDSPDALGGFNLLLNGTQLSVSTKSTKVQAFGASVGVSYARQIFSPTGLATVSSSLAPNIIVGSDSITLVTLDRHTGYVISETALTRNIDYVLDYSSGLIRFINPPLPFDDNFNPQQILVQYEYEGNSGSFVVGGRASTKLGALRVGAGYANESTGTGNLVLFGQSVESPILGSKLRVERLTSSGLVGEQIPSLGGSFGSATSSGSAFRGSLVGSVGVSHYDATYQSTSAGFNDPFAGIATPGLTSMRLNLNRPFAKGDVAFLLDSESNSVYGSKSSNTNVSLGTHQRLGHRLKATLSLAHRIVSSNGVSAPPSFLALSQDATTGSITGAALGTGLPFSSDGLNQQVSGSVTQAEIGLTYAVSPAVQLSFDRTSDIGGSTLASMSDPSQTSFQVTSSLGKTGHAYLRELFTDQPTSSFAESTSNLTQASSATRVTQLGFDDALGPNTSVDTQYSIENSGSGSDIYSAIGVKQRIYNSKSLHSDLLVQRANAVGNGVQGFNLYGVNVAYTPSQSFRSTMSYQLRSGAAAGSTLESGAVGYVGSGLSLIGSLDNSRALGNSYTNDRVGLAFRPNDDDRSSVLFGYQHLAGEGAVIGELTNVLSVDGLVRPTNSLEVSSRLAYKLDGDSTYYAAHSGLFGLRLLQRIGRRSDIATEYVASGVQGVASSMSSGFAVENGYRLGDQFRLALGYSFEQMPDSSFAAAPRRRGVYVTATSVMTSLFGLGRSH